MPDFPRDDLIGPDVTEAQLKAAFLAARKLGQILDDDVLRAILVAGREADNA
jgi:hypothetical protein